MYSIFRMYYYTIYWKNSLWDIWSIYLAPSGKCYLIFNQKRCVYSEGSDSSSPLFHLDYFPLLYLEKEDEREKNI